MIEFSINIIWTILAIAIAYLMGSLLSTFLGYSKSSNQEIIINLLDKISDQLTVLLLIAEKENAKELKEELDRLNKKTKHK